MNETNIRERLDDDLKKLYDQAASSDSVDLTSTLKIKCMLGIIQELREIHRTRADQEESR